MQWGSESEGPPRFNLVPPLLAPRDACCCAVYRSKSPSQPYLPRTAPPAHPPTLDLCTPTTCHTAYAPLDTAHGGVHASPPRCDEGFRNGCRSLSPPAQGAGEEWAYVDCPSSLSPLPHAPADPPAPRRVPQCPRLHTPHPVRYGGRAQRRPTRPGALLPVCRTPGRASSRHGAAFDSLLTEV